MREIGIKMVDFTHGFKRGVYFAPLYENYKEFLRNEITEDKLVLKKKLENEIGAQKVRRELEEKAKLDAIEFEKNKSDSEKVDSLISDFLSLQNKYLFQSNKNKKMNLDVFNLIDIIINRIKK